MSSQIEELMPITMAKGSSMRIFIDHSKPEDSPDHNWIEVTYDGKEDSDILAVPGHWHKDHDEISEVLEGRMIFYLDGKELVTSAGDPPIFIPRGHIHSFTVIKGERLRATERTIPAGTSKALFLQDMILDGKGLPGFLLAMRASYEGDMYASLPGGFKTLDYWFTVIVGFLAKPFVAAKPITLKRLEK